MPSAQNRIFLFGLLLIPLLCFGNSYAAPPAPQKNPSISWYNKLIFSDNSFSFELARSLGYTYSGGADIGEVLSTAHKIKSGDINSWYKHWLALANRIYAFATKMRKHGNIVSAREAYFRASNYFRTAGFYMDAPNVRKQAIATWRMEKRSFLQAIASLPYIKPIRIPYKNTTLPGYFIKSPHANAPLLIAHSGFDGTADELYFEVGLAAYKRGYNVLLFEGPGQGEVIKIQNLPYRYDWEKVITPVVNYAETIPSINKNKIALLGISMGGYFAPRACAFEHRIKACIANGGVYSVDQNIYSSLPKKLTALLKTNPQKFNEIIQKTMEKSIMLQWFFNNGMWTFHAKSPANLLQKLIKYTMKNVANKITMPILILDSADDQLTKGQAKQLYNAIKTPNKSYYLFTREQAAQAHCQMGAIAISNEVIFAWLHKIFTEHK